MAASINQQRLSSASSNILTSINDILFLGVAKLFDSIADPLKKPNDKIRILGQYLQPHLSSPDLFSLFRLILPQIDRQRGTYNIKEAVLARLYTDVFALGKTEADKLRLYKDPAYSGNTQARAGDFSSVLYNLLKPRLGLVHPVLTVKTLNEFLDDLQEAGTNLDSKRQVFIRLRHATAIEHRWIVRIILRDMRFGISHERIFKVLHPKASEIYNSCSDLKELLDAIQMNAAVKSEETSPIKAHELSDLTGMTSTLFKPFKPMLAQRVDPGDIGCLFDGTPAFSIDRKTPSSRALAVETVTQCSKQEECPEYFLEPKLDGERLLCHLDKTGHDPKLEFYTRRSNNYTALYGPSLAQTVLENVKASKAVLDGEVVAWSEEKNEIVPFGSNKTVALGNLSGASLCYVVFDILHYANQQGQFDLTSHPLIERREFLQRVVTCVANRLLIIPWKKIREPQEIRIELDRVIQEKREGLMLKNVNSIYQLNSRKGGWYKVKPTHGSLSDTLDLLVIGGYFADSAKRRNHTSTHICDHLSHFLCVVLVNPIDTYNPCNCKAISFCKIGSGYTLAELEEMRELLRPHISRYLGPSSTPYLGPFRFGKNERPDVVVRSLDYGFVMEVEAAEIVESSTFEAGWTLRFPRAHKPIRFDKSWSDAMTMDELQKMAVETRHSTIVQFPLEQHKKSTEILQVKQEDFEKTSKRFLDSEEDEINEISRLFKRRKKDDKEAPHERRKNIALGGFARCLMKEFQAAEMPTIEKVTDLFEGLQFLVMGGNYSTSDDNDISKAVLEKIIVSNGGNVKQIIDSTESVYIISSGDDFRTRAYFEQHHVPVLHFRYILDCDQEEELLDLHPMYVIHATKEQTEQFHKYFDLFGDSFYEDTTAQQLKNLLDLHHDRLPLRSLYANMSDEDSHNIQKIHSARAIQKRVFALSYTDSDDGLESSLDYQSNAQTPVIATQKKTTEKKQNYRFDQTLSAKTRKDLATLANKNLNGEKLKGLSFYIHRLEGEIRSTVCVMNNKLEVLVDRIKHFLDIHLSYKETIASSMLTMYQIKAELLSTSQNVEEFLSLQIRMQGGRLTSDCFEATHVLLPTTHRVLLPRFLKDNTTLQQNHGQRSIYTTFCQLVNSCSIKDEERCFFLNDDTHKDKIALSLTKMIDVDSEEERIIVLNEYYEKLMNQKQVPHDGTEENVIHLSDVLCQWFLFFLRIKSI